MKCPEGCTCRKHTHGGRYERQFRDPVERFWEKVDKNGPISPQDGTLCWLWTGAPADGRGQFTVGGRGSRKVRPHKFAYEHVVGEVPVDRVLDHRHTCSKLCVNPTHLRPVTRKQNQENRAGPQYNSRSGIRGVTWDGKKNRWRVTVGHRSKQYWGGYFVDPEEAGRAAMALRNELHTHNDIDRIGVSRSGR